MDRYDRGLYAYWRRDMLRGRKWKENWSTEKYNQVLGSEMNQLAASEGVSLSTLRGDIVHVTKRLPPVPKRDFKAYPLYFRLADRYGGGEESEESKIRRHSIWLLQKRDELRRQARSKKWRVDQYNKEWASFIAAKAGEYATHPLTICHWIAQADRSLCANGTIYFLRADDVIKIGYSTKLTKRMSSLRTMSGAKVELLGSMPGSMADEKKIHAIFNAIRAHDEWFHADLRLIEFINKFATKQETT